MDSTCAKTQEPKQSEKSIEYFISLNKDLEDMIMGLRQTINKISGLQVEKSVDKTTSDISGAFFFNQLDNCLAKYDSLKQDLRVEIQRLQDKF